MKKKILIIEDSPTDAAIMKDAFVAGGFETFVAITGEEGLLLARQEKPDLIILDLILPNINGYDVCRLIRQDVELSRTIILVVSAKNQLADITEAIHAGANDYVIKPPLAEFLVNKVKLYLGIAE